MSEHSVSGVLLDADTEFYVFTRLELHVEADSVLPEHGSECRIEVHDVLPERVLVVEVESQLVEGRVVESGGSSEVGLEVSAKVVLDGCCPAVQV